MVISAKASLYIFMNQNIVTRPITNPKRGPTRTFNVNTILISEAEKLNDLCTVNMMV